MLHQANVRSHHCYWLNARRGRSTRHGASSESGPASTPRDVEPPTAEAAQRPASVQGGRPIL